jgi:hypothetical protein
VASKKEFKYEDKWDGTLDILNNYSGLIGLNYLTMYRVLIEFGDAYTVSHRIKRRRKSKISLQISL